MRSPIPGQIYRLKQDAVGKPRPVLVVSRQQLNGGNSIVVVPFTTQQIDKNRDRQNYVLFISGEAGLEELSHAKCGEVTLLRIGDLQISQGPIGTVSPEKLKEVKAAIRWSLELDE